SVAEITNHHVHVVGLTKGLKSLAGPYVFCSTYTARELLRMFPDQTTYVLAKCRSKADAAVVVDRLKHYSNVTAFTSEDFSLRSRMHWLTKTKAGIALGLAAALGLLVGALVTSQTLYAATAASLREYAVLQALGIPRWRMAASVLAQSFWVGTLGIAVAVPVVMALVRAPALVAAPLQLPFWLWGSAVALTMTMALASGLAALRSLRLLEPPMLLRSRSRCMFSERPTLRGRGLSRTFGSGAVATA